VRDAAGAVDLSDVYPLAWAPSTQRRYKQYLAPMFTWRAHMGLGPRPVTTLEFMLYLRDMIRQRRTLDASHLRTALRHDARTNDYLDPTTHPDIAILLRTLRRNRWHWGGHQMRRSDPWTAALLREIDGKVPLRDAALIALSLRCALRPGEAAAIEVRHVACIHNTRMVIDVPRDKARPGTLPPAHLCDLGPHSAFQLVKRQYEEAKGRGDRFLFPAWYRGQEGLKSSSVNSIVKRAARRLGRPDLNLTGRSGRVGFATALAWARIPEPVIREGGDWRSPAWENYVRPDDQGTERIGTALGL